MARRSRPSVVAHLTYVSIAIAAIISLFWFIFSSGESRFEPTVSTLGLLGGMAGLLSERRAAAWERRRIVLVTLDDELRRAGTVLDDLRLSPVDDIAPVPRVYPRLPVSAVDAAVVTGVFIERGDTQLLNRLHQWRDQANGFNRRLEITEMCVFTDRETVEQEMAEFDRALHQGNGYLEQIHRDLSKLHAFLGDRFNGELTAGR